MKKYAAFWRRPVFYDLTPAEIAFVVIMIIAIAKLSFDTKKLSDEEDQYNAQIENNI